ncbi:MAG: GRAM domain-containing protein [Nanoarchaeota archaeon]|nr:GRAM domain-containing protein [Nanoarchaeota archaeon]
MKTFLAEDEKVSHCGQMWYRTPAEGIFGATWKTGHLYLTNKNLYWYYDFDRKVMFQIPLDELKEVRVEKGESYNAAGKEVLIVKPKTTNYREAYLSAKKELLQEWKKVLNQIID